MKRNLAGLLKMPAWDDPGFYLGLPAIWGRHKSNSLSWIRDKIRQKLDGWKEHILNQAGKEVLIKSVIQTIPTYAMAIVSFPKSFCSSLNSMVANFWWRSKGKDRDIHWRNWATLA